MKKKKAPPSSARDERPRALVEMEELKQNLDKAIRMRETLVEKIQQNPEPELLHLFADLNDAINEGTRRLCEMSAAEFRRQFKIIAAELAETIENTDDEEFLRLGEESTPARHLRNYEAQREGFVAALNNMPADINPQHLLADFDAVFAEARQRMEEKRRNAEKLFPHLKKEYEMDAGYQQALAYLLEAIEQRNILAETIKLAPPERRAEGLHLLAQMDKSIEAGEQALANEYETYQTYASAQNDLRQTLKSKTPAELAQLRAHLKKNPGSMQAVEKMLAEEFPEPKGH
ncbi:MAG TPA: hypothetical protein VF721_03920 [Pyrinomonadaceae bacterium]|jgi:hypothetical protein